MDFTLTTYQKLLDILQKQKFTFQTFTEFIESPAEKVIVLRQDVDRLPGNSLEFARIQAERGIKGTYYFRMVGSYNPKITKEIYSLGHEIGYHYEDLRLAAGGRRQAAEVTKRRRDGEKKRLREEEKKGLRGREKEGQNPGELDYEKDLADIAIESFKTNLARLRELAPVKTICMHGSPLSKWDSRSMWKYYDYRDFGIIGEPYFDVDFDKILYLTDTGRRWDGDSVNVRDKSFGWKDIETKRHRDEEINKPPSVPKSLSPSIIPTPRTTQPATCNLQPAPSNQQPATFPVFHSTFDIIKSAEEGRLPDKIVMTFHPQRWTDKPIPWIRELVWQNVKNVGKYFLVKSKAIRR